MANTFICPHCQKEVPLTDALRHEIEEQFLPQLKEKHKKDLEDAERRAGKEYLKEIELLRLQAEQHQKLLTEARQNELELRKQKNELDEQKKSFELDKQRQLDEEREKISQQAYYKAQEEAKYKLLEKDKQLQDAARMNEELKKKLEQGSQQLQGEVQELDLEKTLKEAFPDDNIERIDKGVLGADVRQIVLSLKGTFCGKILWESKRTKTWGNDWTTKLKTDMRSDGANIPALVSEILPEEAKVGMGLKDGVWVCAPRMIIPMAALLRKGLLDCMRQKITSENKQGKAELIYSYVTGHEFHNEVESILEIYFSSKNQIMKERISYERSWKERERQAERVLGGMAKIYGSLQGIAGSALPPIKTLELPEGEIS